MKNKITLLIVIGCMLFCATDVITGDEYIDTTGEYTVKTDVQTDNQGVIGVDSAVVDSVNSADVESSANADNKGSGAAASESSDPLIKAAEGASGQPANQIATLDLSGGSAGVDSADADGDWEDADGNLHSAAGEILFADGTFQDKNGNMYDADGNKMTTSDSLTAAAEQTSGQPATQTATLELAGGDNSTTKNGFSTSGNQVAKGSTTVTLDLSGGSAGEESTTTNDQAKPLTFAETQAKLVAQYEQFLPEEKTWSTATEWEKAQALLDYKAAESEQSGEAIESKLPNGENLETAPAEEIAEAGVETMVQEAAANTTSANPALDAFFKLSQSILDWFDTVFGKITEIFNNFDSIFNGTKTTTKEINIQNFKAQLLAERNAAPDLSPARMSDIQTSVDASSNEANNINAAKTVLGITDNEFTAEDVENAYSDTSLKKAAVNQILDGTQSINIATNIKNAYKVLLNNIPTENQNLQQTPLVLGVV